jgi:hypothetical protein
MLELFYSLHLSPAPALSPHEHVFPGYPSSYIRWCGEFILHRYCLFGSYYIYILDWGCIQLLALLLFLPLFGRPYQAVFAGQMSLCVELAP